MPDLFEPLPDAYSKFYRSLGEAREIFHREGRIGDSNAKLDEIVKLISIHYYFNNIDSGSIKYKELFRREKFSIESLNENFNFVASRPPFSDGYIGSIFGGHLSTAFEIGDEAVAFSLFKASGHAFEAHIGNEQPVDALNEAFGHFVRDNFRSHTEDAQYMTPPEVVEFMVALALKFLPPSIDALNDKTPFIMMDPSCGVGSFITAWRKAHQLERWHRPLLAIGQDKVERMVRLATFNLILANNTADRIHLGNSVLDGSPISAFDGLVDLILTNPPFGARFPISEIRARSTKSTPIFALSEASRQTVDSELLFLDRYLTLLRPGGICLAVVPDGVISAKGTASFLRQQITRRASLRAVVELPPVTFAQAGTRTKTAILAFQKNGPAVAEETQRVFFAEAGGLGFEVSKRKGVPIKRTAGDNQLPDILQAFQDKADRLVGEPSSFSATWQEIDPARVEAWTPRQFSINRKVTGSGIEFTSSLLGNLLEPPVRRRSEPHGEHGLFISVLHVIGEGVIDLAAIRAYKPITPGTPIFPGEVIISRLNPRIPRVLVVPDFGTRLLCSSEFEVLRPKSGISPYALAYLLLSTPVQHQIYTLTAGTSASHSRVKAEKLWEIQVPWPNDQSAFSKLVSRYQAATELLVRTTAEIRELREQMP